LNVAVCVFVGAMVFVLWRWKWLRRERRRFSAFSNGYSDRFDSEKFQDEDDRLYTGRVISRLRTHLIEGRVEIHWEYRRQFIHRGFVLTAKCRRNDGVVERASI